jgi:hypothetical protein
MTGQGAECYDLVAGVAHGHPESGQNVLSPLFRTRIWQQFHLQGP